MATKLKAASANFDIKIRLRLEDEGDHSRAPEPERDLYSIWVENHSACKLGKPRRVGYTGMKVVEKQGDKDVQVRGMICWIAEHGLHKADMLKIQDYVSTWQASPEEIRKSKEDPEELL